MSDTVPTWTRSTPWRQGSVLERTAVEAIGLATCEDSANTCAMVISHDCDVANDQLSLEPHVEVIVGRFIDQVNGNFSMGKNPRTLHLEIDQIDRKVVIELTATDKVSVSKVALAVYNPDRQFAMSGRNIGVLRAWLAARYRRSAFPDAFNDQLRMTGIDKKMSKLLAPKHALFSHVYAVIDGGASIDHSDGSAFELSIILVFVPGEDPEQAADEAMDVADSIEGLFESIRKIRLKGCLAISEDDFPIGKAESAMEWRLEHLSLRDAQQEVDLPN